MNVLHFVHTQVWKALFGKNSDSLEKSFDKEDEYMIIDYEPITSTFVSVPPQFGQLSADAYIAGIVAGVLDGAGFSANVTAHSVKLGENDHPPAPSSSSSSLGTSTYLAPRKEKLVILIKFDAEVMEREAAMDR